MRPIIVATINYTNSIMMRLKKCLKYVIIYDVSISKPENACAGSNYFNLQKKNMKHKKG